MDGGPDIYALICAKFTQYFEHIAAAAVGFIGGAVAHLQDVAGKREKFSWVAMIAGALASSCLSPLCYLIFRDSLGMTPELSFWLAGFMSFLGADHVKARILKFLESRLP